VATIEELVATNMRSRRQELGFTQADLAELAAAAGAAWTQAKVALVETGRRQIGLGEALLLGNILGVGLDQLVIDPNDTGTSTIDVAGVSVTTEQLARMLQGQPVLTRDVNREWKDVATTMMGVALRGQRRRLRELANRYGLKTSVSVLTEIEANAHGTAERTLAKRLGVTPAEVAAASLALWGHRLLDEREAHRSNAPRPTTRTDITSKLVEELRHRIETAR
jgi:transcriptional regulator with XRE-family HTH domain